MLAALHVITLGAGNPATVGRSPRAVPLEGQLGVNFTNWHTKLRSELLQGYDVMSPPISNRAKNTNASDGSFSLAAKLSEAGADISLQLRVLKLDSVDLSGGSMAVKVWVRMQWNDLRLAWNPDNYGGLHTVKFWSHPSDGHEIWVPDITTYNTRGSLADQVGAAWIDVYSDGSTFYSRAGNLDILCKFQGLVKFPFDRDVRCDLDMGGWMTGGASQGIYLTPGVPGDPSKFRAGVDFLPVLDSWDESAATSYEVATERSTGSTYVAYAMTKVTATTSVIVYDCCKTNPFPVMTYTFHFARTTQMITILLLPLGFLTFLVHFAFFMETDDNNRVIYCMTILLIIMVVKDMTYSLVPLTGELMWIHMYIVFCEFIVKLITLQSFIVFFLSRYTRAFLFPSVLMVYIFFTTKSIRSALAGEGSGDVEAPNPSPKPKSATVVPVGEGTPNSPLPSRLSIGTAGTAVVGVNRFTASINKNKAPPKDVFKKKGLRESDLLEDDMMHHDKKAVEGTGEDEGPPPSIAMRRIKWERIFYQMDNDLRGFLHEEEAVAFYTFIRLDLTQKEIKKKAHEMESDDQMLVLSEFIKVSETLLGKVTGELVDAGFENYMSCREMIKMRHNRRWRALANRIDEWCRVWVPIFYITCLFMLFNVSLDDGYGPDKDGVVKSRVVFQGLPPVIEIEDGMAGAVRILALPVIVLILGPMFFCARQLLLKSLTKDQNREFLNKSFGLKPNYSWVKEGSWWGWLFSTAHAVDNKKKAEEKWGPRYTAADLDRLIGYKIYPDSRTRLVEGHKVAQEDKKAGGGPGGRFGMEIPLGLPRMKIPLGLPRMKKKKDGDATTEAAAAATIRHSAPATAQTAVVPMDVSANTSSQTSTEGDAAAPRPSSPAPAKEDVVSAAASEAVVDA